MNKTVFNERRCIRFNHFTNKGFALFSCLGKEVIIGILSVATLSNAQAKGISTDVQKADTSLYKSGQPTLLDEVKVTGSRAPLTQSQQSRMVTVLSRKDVNAAPVHSVNDLLKLVSGVDVRQRGPLGAQTDVSIRGGNYEQMTVLLNGINIGDPQTGHNAFDFPVDISEIERIEILEGPAASVYGTSSLLGAINIVTKANRTSSVTLHAASGSFGSVTSGGRINVARGKWNNQLSGSFIRTDGYNHNKAGALNTDFRSQKAFYQGFYDDDDLSISWHAGLSNKDFGSSTNYSSKYDDQFEHTFKTYTAVQAETRKGAVKWRPAIYWNHNYDRFELFRDHAERYPFNYHRTDVYGVNVNAYFDWTLGRTAFGAELRNEDLVSTNLGNPLSKPKHVKGTDNVMYKMGLNRTNIQFVAEHNLLIGRLTMSAGVVGVKNSWAEMNVKVYPSINASYRFGDAWKVYASYNTSLRMPSVTELFYSVGGHKADPNLKPEELSAVEVGVKYNKKGLSGTVSSFYNHHTNLIDWIDDGEKDAAGAILWKSVNFGTINALGFETTLNADFRQLLPSQKLLKSFSVGYCFIQQHQIEAAGIHSLYALEYLKNKVTSSLQLNLWKALDLNVNYRFQHRMGTYKDPSGALHRYGSYGLLDARLAWNMPKYSLYLEGNNLLNRSYVDVGNVKQPGCWVMAGGSLTLHL